LNQNRGWFIVIFLANQAPGIIEEFIEQVILPQQQARRQFWRQHHFIP
jgi:hypothetical protein